MPSVSFCNLSDAWGSEWEQQSNGSNDILNLNKKKKVSEQSVQPSEHPSEESNHDDCPECKNRELMDLKAFKANQESLKQNLNNVPNLPTFQNAANCNARNNQFQNEVSQDSLQIPVNPLNQMNVEYNPPHHNPYNNPYGSEGQLSPNNRNSYNQFNQAYNSQNYPQNNMPGAPGNLNPRQSLPVSQQFNTWPPQQWIVDPEGPIGYQNFDPFYRNFGPGISNSYRNYMPTAKGIPNPNNLMFYNYPIPNEEIIENFENQRPKSTTDKILEFFGAESLNKDKDQGDRLLKAVLAILILLFILQFVELMISCRTPVEK